MSLDRWQESLDVVVDRTKHERYRFLCSEDNAQSPPNDRDSYRRLMIELEKGPKPKPVQPATSPPSYPSVPTRIATAAGAAVRVVDATLRGEPVFVDDAVFEERSAMCRSNVCGFFDDAKKQCRKCGCYTAAKLRLATEQCPADPPLWLKVIATTDH
jgi:hypothetical protein